MTCEDCPPVGYPTDETRCTECERRSEISSPAVPPAAGGAEETVAPTAVSSTSLTSSPALPPAGGKGAADIADAAPTSTILNALMSSRAIVEGLIREQRNVETLGLHGALAEIGAAIRGAQAMQEAQWQDISTARKDGTIIWAKLRDDIYPVLRPTRDDLALWNGVQIPLRHPGLAENGRDFGWGIAAPVGNGGFPDEWIAGWLPLPLPPLSKGGADNG